jgi:hypothetical protein
MCGSPTMQQYYWCYRPATVVVWKLCYLRESFMQRRRKLQSIFERKNYLLAFNRLNLNHFGQAFQKLWIGTKSVISRRARGSSANKNFQIQKSSLILFLFAYRVSRYVYKMALVLRRRQEPLLVTTQLL